MSRRCWNGGFLGWKGKSGTAARILCTLHFPSAWNLELVPPSGFAKCKWVFCLTFLQQFTLEHWKHLFSLCPFRSCDGQDHITTCLDPHSYVVAGKKSIQTPWLTASFFQFLKAPHLLALPMNSFSREPSICQNAAVCVTSVKWLTQNLKQNSSKS